MNPLYNQEAEASKAKGLTSGLQSQRETSVSVVLERSPLPPP